MRQLNPVSVMVNSAGKKEEIRLEVSIRHATSTTPEAGNEDPTSR